MSLQGLAEMTMGEDPESILNPGGHSVSLQGLAEMTMGEDPESIQKP